MPTPCERKRNPPPRCQVDSSTDDWLRRDAEDSSVKIVDGHVIRPPAASPQKAAAAWAMLVALGLTGCGSVPVVAGPPAGTHEATATAAPATIQPTASVRLAAGAGLMLPGEDGALYVATETGIYRVDPRTNEAARVVDGLAAPYGFNIGFQSAWISRADDKHGWIERYDLRDGALVAEIEVGRMPLETITAFGSVWAPNHHSSSVSRIDPNTNTVVATIEVMAGRGDPYGLAADGRMLWSTSPNGGAVSGIDPATNSAVHEIPASACGVAALAGRVWAAACESPLVIAFPSTGGAEVGRIRAGLPLTDGEHFWTTQVPMAGPISGDVGSLVVSAFDPDTLRLGTAVDTGVAEPSALVVAVGSLWVTSGDEVHRFSLDDLPI